MGFTSKLSNDSKDKSAPSSPRPSYSNGSASNGCSKAQQQQLSLSISSSNQSGSGSSGYATHSALKFGAEANTMITTIVEAVCNKCDPLIEPTYLHVNQLCAVEALKPHDFDLIVVGGGTGGVAAALEAAELGKKVACLDCSKPNSIDSSNGSSVNMGSVWKNLMHQTARLGEAVEDAKNYGWNCLTNSSSSCKTKLIEKQVTYINSHGVFTGTHEITATNQKDNVEQFTADRFVLAVGMVPKLLEVPGAKECCITRHNPVHRRNIRLARVRRIFAVRRHKVTVLSNTPILEGLDQEMSEKVRNHMSAKGVIFEKGVPLKFERLEEAIQDEAGLVRVIFESYVKSEDGNQTKKTCEESYNTVIIAIGKTAPTQDLGLEKLSISLIPNTQKFKSAERGQCPSLPNIYSIGNTSQRFSHCAELPVLSKQSGKGLIRRLYTEYGCCGLSEKSAIAKYGEEAYLCIKEKVLGIHILSPTASEIIPGLSMALKLGATKSDFDQIIETYPSNDTELKNCTNKQNEDFPRVHLT
uniref:Uncharacterized protein n=1 Tax=Ditylenchus dipsaci TaxID=166011 RepID=A0A915EHT9_9BILA